MASDCGIRLWYPTVASDCGIRLRHLTIVSDHCIQPYPEEPSDSGIAERDEGMSDCSVPKSLFDSIASLQKNLATDRLEYILGGGGSKPTSIRRISGIQNHEAKEGSRLLHAETRMTRDSFHMHLARSAS